jgi:hypothetical protein
MPNINESSEKVDPAQAQPQTPSENNNQASQHQARKGEIETKNNGLAVTASSSSPSTPENKLKIDGMETTADHGPSTPPTISGFNLQNANSAGYSSGSSGKKTRYKGKGIGPNGQPRNFYNPPSKVMRQLAQQSYYENFYGNQAKFYTLRQKYKT